MSRIRPLALTLGVSLAACGGSPPPAPPAPPPAPTAVEAAPSTEGETAIPARRKDDGPEVDERAVETLESGKKLAAQGDLSSARERFREAARMDRSFAEAHYNLGVLEEWQGRYAEARQAYEAAIAARAEFGPAVAAIANMMVRTGDVAGAVRFAEDRLARSPENLTLRNAANQIRLAAGRTDEVIRDSKLVLRKDEKNVDAMKNLASAYARQEKFELALAILRNAQTLDPDDPDIYNRMALAHLKLNEKPQARQALEAAIKLPGGATAEVHNNLGLLYHEAGDFAGAEAQFRSALARWPDMLAAQVNLANALKGQQKYAEADAAMKRAQQLAPNAAEVLFNFGILYLDGQVPGVEPVARLEQAVGYFQRYKQLGRTQAEDPVDKYIAEAQKRIEVEKKRAEQARSAPKAATPGDGKQEEAQ